MSAERRPVHAPCAAAVVAIVALAACDRARSTPAPAPAPASAPTAAGASPASAAGTPCGELACAQFDAPADALRAALTGDPLVVAIGEAHAPRGATVPSAARRFTDDLLPLFAGKASDLLVELMMPPAGCVDAAAEVRKKQTAVTAQQAPTNQSEYVALGERARALGVVPDMLRPSCADMDRVQGAGDGAIEASLEMIARLSVAQAGRLLDRDARSDADRSKLVVVYGGMLHNDLTPTPERRAWSYAPALDAKTGGRLVSIDLVVPEYIVDDATWRPLPWFALYDRARLGARTTLFRVAERSYVIVFPETKT